MRRLSIHRGVLLAQHLILGGAALLASCARPSEPPAALAQAPAAAASRKPTAGTLPPADWQAQAMRRIRDGEYALRADGAELRATNREQNLRVHFHPNGLELTERELRDAAAAPGRLGAEPAAEPLALALRTRALVRGDARADAQASAFAAGSCRHDGLVDEQGDCLKRAEQRQAGWVEWWENRQGGLEQGFDVAARPLANAANAPLRIEVAIDADQISIDADRQGATLERGGHTLRYAELAANDARGRALPVRLVDAEGGVAIEVDDRDATYPIVVDPTLTRSWATEGNLAGAKLGFSVASAGDVDADGYGDVIIGVPGYTNGESGEGRVYVYYGGANGVSTTRAAWTAEANKAGAAFGTAVASAGDVNGDGASDVIVGAPNRSNPETNEGRAYVYHGAVGSGLALPAAGSTSPSPSWMFETNQANAFAGNAVASAGDVNGDGFGDVLVAANKYDGAGKTDEGRVFLFLGHSSGLSGSVTAPAPDWQVGSGQSGSLFGDAVAGADVNGDGLSDVLIGDGHYDNPLHDEGAAFAYRGNLGSIPATTPSWAADSNLQDAQFGASLANAGDVTGDGLADVIIGAPHASEGQADEGKAFMYAGRFNFLPPSLTWAAAPTWTAQSDQAGAQFGTSVASAGDLNGDGYADAIVGAPGFTASQSHEGRVFMYQGSNALMGPWVNTGLSPAPLWTWDSGQANARAGNAVACAGDLDGNGYSDLIFGASAWRNPDANEGRVWTYLGGIDGPTTLFRGGAWASSAGEYYGAAVASAGDVNGDGFDDVLIGAPGYDNGETDEGRAYLYFGGVGFSNVPVWTVESNQASAGFGAAVAGAGDVNGDGYADIAVGAYAYDRGQQDEGCVFVYHGHAGSVPSATPDWTGEMNQPSAYFGQAVASAGDVNGDGIGDLVVGAYYYDYQGLADEGSVFMYLGSVGNGLPATPTWSAGLPYAPGASYGYSLRNAGDINGDSLSDLIVGAPGYDKGALIDAGRVELFMSTGVAYGGAAAWTIDGAYAGEQLGSSVAGAGDVNGDGYPDVIVGAQAYTNGVNQAGEGYAAVYLNDQNRSLRTTPAWQIESNQAGAHLGTSVGSAGDMNADGFADVFVSAPEYSNDQAQEGRVFVYYGGTNGINAGLPPWTAESDITGIRFGFAVASGDWNGDGLSDLLVGAFLNDDVGPKIDAGSMYGYFSNAANGPRGYALLPQARRTGTTTPIPPGGYSTSTLGFDAALLGARGPMGRARLKLRVEAKPFNQAFDGTGQLTTAFTDSTTAGTTLTRAVNNVNGPNAHWRARLLYDPSTAPWFQRSRWIYGGEDGSPRAVHVRLR